MGARRRFGYDLQMALVRCPDCAREVSDTAPACPGCARPMATPPPPRRGPAWLRAGLLTALVMGVALVVLVLFVRGRRRVPADLDDVSSFAIPPSIPSVPVEEPCPTENAFAAIHEGLNRQQVESAMGMPGVVQSESTVGGSTMQILVFQCSSPLRVVSVVLSNGALMSKTQLGLH